MDRRFLKDLEGRIADSITSFAGSMIFVYFHVIIFTTWIITKGFGHDPFPFNFLTMTVSLEAIFLATFVMISQNRQEVVSEKRSIADFETNKKAEKEVREIKQMIEKLIDTANKK